MKLNKTDRKNMEHYLDYRWQIWQGHELQADKIFYEGCIAMVEHMGLYWERLESGKHFIYGG